MPTQNRPAHYAQSICLNTAVPTPTTPLRPGRRLRHHSLEQLPQLVGHQLLSGHHAPRLRINQTQRAPGGG